MYFGLAMAHIFGDPGGSVGTFLVSYSGFSSRLDKAQDTMKSPSVDFKRNLLILPGL